MTGIGTAAAPSGAALSARRKALVLVICCLSLFIVGLDNTIVNLALPSIRRDLGAGLSALQWVIDAYTLALASLLMLAGSVADRMGRRRTFQTGLVLFSLGSLLCSLAPDAGWLIAFRVVQALGGSMLNPVAMSIITTTFTDPRQRARAIGVWGGVIGVSMALGPVIGGVLVDAAGWRSVFWLNVPIGLTAVVLCALFVPESKVARPRRLDPVGQIVVVALLGTTTFAIIEGPAHGWGSALILSCLAGALVSLAVLIGYERRRREPLLDPGFFTSAAFSGAVVIAVAAVAALGGFLFLTSLYLQDVRQFSPLQAGVRTLPMAVAVAVAAPVSGRIVGARGSRAPLVFGGTGLLVAGVLLTRLSPDTSTGYLVLAYLVFGLGFGVLNAPVTHAAVSGMPDSQAGVAAAVASTSRQFGATLGVAIFGSLAGRAVADRSVTTGWWVMAGCGALILAVGLATTSRWARTTGRSAARGTR
ncbi:MFS transporter [Amycolatopsis ultiminotia]|uniref:MFS transporter n=1 Tax=Amycolatopsis ultiminotia TaxID=543629 RepID=A0ABP6V547_9PSEU